jgi:hypothetical protein
MSEHLSYDFKSVFDSIVPTLHLKECEIYILWTLGEEGPMSIYALSSRTPAKEVRCLPEISPVFGQPSIWEIKMEENPRYDYRIVNTKALELLKKKLIQKQQMPKEEQKRRKRPHLPRAHESRKGVGLTFLGLMCYLQNMKDSNEIMDRKFENAIHNYSILVPFSAQWNSLINDLGEEKCIGAFEKTVKEFVNIQNVQLRIELVKLEFNGFLKRSSFTSPPQGIKITKERDDQVGKCLKRKDMSLLRNSYIAYLATSDIWTLDEETLERILPELESEKELAYLEDRSTDTNSLFKGNRLKEFLPEYADIGHFFTGIFVNNLLWNERIVEKAKEEAKTPDYEVEFY